jgi:hypothetical protein
MFWLALTVIAGCVAFFLTRRYRDRVRDKKIDR